MDDRKACCGPLPRCCDGGAIGSVSLDTAERWARWFQALADPTRVRILALLARHGKPLCVCDIVAHFQLGQPTISHHLRTLREAGLVRATRRGGWVYYAPASGGLAAVRAALETLATTDAAVA